MNFGLVERIANAVLYEGYILYPYRPSAVKNRQRWTFGGIYPKPYSLAQGGTDAWTMQTECLVECRGGSQTAPTLNVKVRFLHLLAREVEELVNPLPEIPNEVEPMFRPVGALRVGEKLFQTWQEAVEREITAQDIDLREIVARPESFSFAFPPQCEVEPLRSSTGEVVGLVVRRQQLVEGVVEIAAERVEKRVFKITIKIMNLTPFGETSEIGRDKAQMSSFVSTHTILGVREGDFVSLLDPPEQLREITAGCANIGTWPVLVGEEGERDAILSSPIILYDYPQIAPESSGEFFDGTEIDEMLTLRVMTLTDEEKFEMCQADERARALLQRTETISNEQFMKLHGTIRNLRPVKEEGSR